MIQEFEKRPATLYDSEGFIRAHVTVSFLHDRWLIGAAAFMPDEIEHFGHGVQPVGGGSWCAEFK